MTTTLDELCVEAVHLGPTWELDVHWNGPRDPTGYILPHKTLGWQILRWVANNLLDDEGNPFKPTREQVRFILWWYAVDDTGRFVYRRGVLQRLKGWGKDPLAAVICAVEFVGPCRFSHFALKAIPEEDIDVGDPVAVSHPRAWVQVAAVSKEQPLALDTRVRTPDGWTTVEKLSVGDFVYDEHGYGRQVRRETEVMNGLDCYRLTFDDGKEVVASASHGWTVERKRLKGDYHVQETLSTKDLATGYLDSKGGRRVRISVPGVDSPDVVGLPIDPYILGFWLGDGCRRNGSFAIDWRHKDELAAILQPLLGESERLNFTYIQDNTGTLNIRNVSRHAANGTALITRLRDLGVLYNKHIPDLYAFAGTEQRRALLQGLIDSDGCVLPDGQVRFTNADRELIDDTRTLVESLGYKAHTRGVGPNAWVVGFRPDEEPVARLGYKVERQRPRVKPQATYRYLRTVEKVASVPVKCIGIDTPTHLFQVEGGVLTHNTQNTMLLFHGLFTAACMAEHSIDLGKEKIYAYHGQRQIQAVTSSPRTLEGGRPTFVVKNETHHWLSNNEGHAMSSVIDRNATKSKMGAARSLAITNAYEPSEDSVAQREREAWEAETAGLSVSTGVLYDSLEAPPDARLRPPPVEVEGRKIEPTDDEIKAYLTAIVNTVRGDADWLDVESIISSILDRVNPPSKSRRFWFNQVVAAEDAWVDPVAVDVAIHSFIHETREGWVDGDRLFAGWDIVLPDEPVVLFGDGSKSDDATGVVGCRLSDGYVFTVGVWQKPRGERGQKWLSPRAEVDARIKEAFDRFNIVGYWFDPSHALDDDDASRYWDGYVDEWMRRYKDRLQLWVTKTGNSQHAIMFDMTSPERQRLFVEAAETFVEELESRDDVEQFDPQFTHDGHPALVNHLKNARRNPSNRYGVTLMKENRESPNKIDLAVCAVGARLMRRLILNKGVEEKETYTNRIWGAVS